MKKIIWTTKLAIGIDEIDNQHKQFIKILNTCCTPKNIDSQKLKEIFSELIEFVRVHFSTEEKYFEKWGYPYAQEHMIEHEKLIINTLKYQMKFEKIGGKVVPELLKFLEDWFENHLKKHDFKYRDYFREKGFI